MEYTITDALERLHYICLIQATYLGIYATVTLAVVTYIGSKWGKREPLPMYIFIFCGYYLFSFINASEVQNWQEAIEEAQLSIGSYVEKNEEKIDPSFHSMFADMKKDYSNNHIGSFRITKRNWIYEFHKYANIAVLGIIVISYFFREEANKSG